MRAVCCSAFVAIALLRGVPAVADSAPPAPPAPTAPAPAAPAAVAPAAVAPAPAADPPAAAATPTPPVVNAPATALPPPQKPRLLVIDLVDKGAGPDITAAVNQAVQGQAVQSHPGETVTYTQVRVALDAAANQQLLGCDAAACMVDVGNTLQAALILGGNVSKVGDDVVITLLTVRPSDGSRLGQVQRKVPLNRDLYYYAAKQLASVILTGHSSDPRVPVLITVAGGMEATIVVDGAEVARASTYTAHLEPGSHEIRVRHEGRAEWKTVLSVEDAAPTQVTASLVETRASLWPAAAVTGGLTVVGAGTATALWLMALDQYSGDVLPGEPNKENSYLYKTPTDTFELYSKQSSILALWGGDVVKTDSSGNPIQKTDGGQPVVDAATGKAVYETTWQPGAGQIVVGVSAALAVATTALIVTELVLGASAGE